MNYENIYALTEGLNERYKDHIRKRFEERFITNEAINPADRYKSLREKGILPRDHILMCMELIKPLEDDFYKGIFDRLKEFDDHMMQGTLIKRGRSEVDLLEELLRIYCDCLGSRYYQDVNHGGRFVYFEMPEFEAQLRKFLYYELSETRTRMRAVWNNCEEYAPGIKEPKKKENLTFDDLPYFDDMPKGYYQKYDNCDAVNVNKTKEIPIDYDGWMGVPITALDKPWIMAKMEIKRHLSNPIINGKPVFKRIICRWIWDKLLTTYQTGEPLEVEGAYHSLYTWAENKGLTVHTKPA